MISLVEDLLATVEIPDGAWPQILTSYRSSCLDAIVRNHSLGRHALPLLKPATPTNILRSLIWSANPFILDAILDSRDRRAKIVRAVLNTWRLSLADQRRLVEPPLGRDTVLCLLRDPSIAPEIRLVLATTPRYQKVKISDCYGPSDYYRESPTSQRYPLTRLSCNVTTTALLTGTSPGPLITKGANETIETLTSASSAYVFTALTEATPEIWATLKNASTPTSLRAWELFMHLISTASKGTITDLLDISMRLSLAHPHPGLGPANTMTISAHQP